MGLKFKRVSLASTVLWPMGFVHAARFLRDGTFVSFSDGPWSGLSFRVDGRPLTLRWDDGLVEARGLDDTANWRTLKPRFQLVGEDPDDRAARLARMGAVVPAARVAVAECFGVGPGA